MTRDPNRNDWAADISLSRDPDQIELRLACLKLAVEVRGDVLEDARRFYAFVSGEDAKTPRQLIDAALEAANVR